jgi:tRNA-modifying protein YgfZ
MQNNVSTDFNFSVCLNAPGAADGLALICARGADAGSFLQGQLTQDVLLMKENEARLAAWCSAKGRMLASFIVWKNSAEEFYLLLSADLLAATLKRLKMFVLRSKCVLTDETANFEVMGLAGELANTMNLGAISADSMPATSPKHLEKCIALSPGWHGSKSEPRALRITPASAAPAHNADLLTRWNYLEVTSGIARLTAPVSEAFVPQMLNYESVGGVNFKKGCYPGQEVVARSQFRGTLKRRACLVRSDAALQAGQEVFESTDPEQPCGTVAQAAAHGTEGFVAIVSMQTSAAQSASLHAGSPEGAKLYVLSLPYALRDDI